MKKILFLVVASLVFISGCSKKAEEVKVPNEFEEMATEVETGRSGPATARRIEDRISRGSRTRAQAGGHYLYLDKTHSRRNTKGAEKCQSLCRQDRRCYGSKDKKGHNRFSNAKQLEAGRKSRPEDMGKVKSASH